MPTLGGFSTDNGNAVGGDVARIINALAALPYLANAYFNKNGITGAQPRCRLHCNCLVPLAPT